MKRLIQYFFMISFSLLADAVSAQSLQRMSIGAIGGQSPQLLFTGGQPAADSFSDSSLSVVTGYQQPVQIPIDTTVYAPSVVNVCGSFYRIESGIAPFYQWYKDNQPIPGAVSRYITVKESGLYKVVFYDGKLTYTHSRIIRVYFRGLPEAVVTTSGPATICSGQYVLLKAGRESGAAYQWRKYGQPVQGANSPDFRATETGVYSVIVTSRYGCTKSSAGVAVRVNLKPTAVITSAGSAVVCSGKPVLLRTAAGSGYSYLWKKNGVVIAGANSFSYSATETGVYTVEITTSAGCVSVSPGFSVRVNPLPLAGITTYGSATICAGKTVTLRSTGGNGFTYQWKRNGANIPGANQIMYTAQVTGTYTVAVTNTTGCTSVSMPVNITVLQVPIARISPAGSTVLSPGGQVLLRANTGAGLTYQWKRNGAKISGATLSTYSATTAGSYTVAVMNPNGCSAESLPLLITTPMPDGRVMAGNLVLPTDAAVSGPVIKVYPNPLPVGTDLKLDLVLPENDDIHLTVSDIHGKLILVKRFKPGQHKLSIPGSAGIYILDFRWGENERKVIRVYRN